MVSKEFSEVAVEINSIFENLSTDILNKIPINFQNLFKKIASKTYKFEYDKTKTLDEQKLKPKTKGIIALIYRDYICDEIEKKEYIKAFNQFLNNKEKQKSEIYNPNNIFKKNRYLQLKIPIFSIIRSYINASYDYYVHVFEPRFL